MQIWENRSPFILTERGLFHMLHAVETGRDRAAMSGPKAKPKREVIKHSAAIQIENNITLLQRRAWNVLLYNAYNELLSEEEHHIRVREVMKVLEFDSKNEAYLKEALEALVSCKVKWNMLDKDGGMEWGVAALLASAVIKNGVCSYAYSPPLRKRLYNPRMYARLSLSLQNRFASKYAHTLWEVCADYLGTAREHGETPFIPLEKFRKLVGLSEEMFPQFKRLNDKVIKHAMDEINQVSDLRVTVEYQRQNRKVTALKFKVRRVLMLPASRQAHLFPDLEDIPMVVKLLTDAGLAHRDAFEVWQEGFGIIEPDKRPADVGENPEEAFTRYVREKIDLLNQRRETGKLSNPSGFLLTAIKKNYGNAKLEQEEKGRARKRREREVQYLEEQKQQVTREMDDALQEVVDQMLDAVPDLLSEAVEALKAARRMPLYNGRKTPQENYRASPVVRITVGQWLESRFPERFAKARQPFVERLDSFEANIDALDDRKVAVTAG